MSGRKPHFKHGAVFIPRRDHAVIVFRRGPGNGKPYAMISALPPVESLKDMGEVFRRDPRSVVSHAHKNAPVLGAACQMHLTAGISHGVSPQEAGA